MIDFCCPSCDRAFSVPDAATGRKARCKCGALLVVPERLAVVSAIPRARPPASPPAMRTARPPAAAPPPPAVPTKPAPSPAKVPAPIAPAAPTPSPARIPMRTRRLMADAQQMAQAFRDFPIISVRPVAGDPPEVYQVDYAVEGLESKNGKPVKRTSHRAEIQLTSDYPRLSPKCKMLTPIFHPNFDPTTICVGDHWTAGERLVDLVVRIGEMISYQAYNIKSPLDAEAAMWADLHPEKLPIDRRTLRPPGME